MSNVDIVLSDLSFSVQMMSASMDIKTPPSLYDISAVAVFTVSTNNMKNVFQFRTDSFDTDNVEGNDVKYYIDMSEWPSGLVINPANAALDYSNPSISSGAIALTSYSGTTLSSEKMKVKHDYVRYLALQLFGSYDATDIFNNEAELITNLEYIGDGSEPGHVWYDISYALHRVSTTGNNVDLTFDSTTGEYYMTNAVTTADNLCREMFLQIADVTPERLQSIEQTTDRQPLLFQNGDSINFKVTIHAAEGQNNLTGVPAIPSRTYQIKLYMVSV